MIQRWSWLKTFPLNYLAWNAICIEMNELVLVALEFETQSLKTLKTLFGRIRIRNPIFENSENIIHVIKLVSRDTNDLLRTNFCMFVKQSWATSSVDTGLWHLCQCCSVALKSETNNHLLSWKVDLEKLVLKLIITWSVSMRFNAFCVLCF